MPSWSLCAVNEVLAHLLNAAADRQIVVARGNDQVGPNDGAFFIDLVVVNQHAARSLDHAHTFKRVDAGGGSNMLVQNLRAVEEHLDFFERVEDLNQPRVVIQECAVRGSAKALVKFLEFGVRFGKTALLR